MNNEMPRFVVVLGEIGEGLVRIPLAKLGRWWKGKQKFAITRQDLETVVANFRKKANGEVVIDYDHSTEFAAGQGQPAPAAGWLKSIDDGPDASGVLWGQAEFTEKAREMLASKEYKYISPVIAWGTRNKTTGEQQGATITSVALTNQPVLEEMPAIALSEGWVVETTTEVREEKAMVKRLILADRVACMVRAVLEDGTESMLSVEGLTPEPKIVLLSDVKRAADGRFEFSTLPEGKDVVIASEVVRAMTVQSELDAAVKDGRILPAQRTHFERLALSDLAGFREIVKTMKPQLELSERGIAGDGAGLSELAKVEGQIDAKAREKISANTGLQYHEALKLVASENPDLDRRRTQLIREKVS
jgi:phage I-like protein